MGELPSFFKIISEFDLTEIKNNITHSPCTEIILPIRICLIMAISTTQKQGHINMWNVAGVH